MEINWLDPLILVCLISIAVLIVSIIVFAYVRTRKVEQPAANSTENYIKTLKKTTADFGIPYQELKIGRELGKGSQGEVFEATWRYCAVYLLCLFVCPFVGLIVWLCSIVAVLFGFFQRYSCCCQKSRYTES
jgi:hypothetical protein